MRPYSLPFGGWVYRRGGAGSLEVSRFSLFYTHKLRFYPRFQGVSLRSELVNLAAPYITRRKHPARQQCQPFSSPRVSSLLLSSLVLSCSFPRLLLSSLLLSCLLVFLFLRLPCCLSSFVLCSPVSFCVSFCLLSLLLPVCFSVVALCVFLCASLRLVLSGRVVGVLSVDVVGLCCSDRVRCMCSGCSVVVFSSVAVYPLFCYL